MKKVFAMLLTLVGMSLVAYTQVFGQSSSFPVSASIPEGSYGATITGIIYKSPTGPDDWTTIGKVDTMTFGELAEISDVNGKKLGVFAPKDNRYYAIDIGISGGGKPTSFPGITIEWYGDTMGLGDRVGATYKLMTWVSATENTETTIGTPQLVNLPAPGAVNSEASYDGHWMRVYVGIITDPALYGFTDSVEAAKHIFTYTTPAGIYSGTLTVRIG